MAQSEKTEKATPKKRKDERKKGKTYQSKDVVSVVILLMGFIVMNQLVAFIYGQLKEFYFSQIDKVINLQTLTIASSVKVISEMVKIIFISALPVLLVLMVAGIVMTGVQTGFLISSESIKFKLDKFNPVEGAKKLVSIRSLVELLKSVLKVALIILIIYSSVTKIMAVAPDMLATSLSENIAFLRESTMDMVFTVVLIFAVVAAADFAYQRYDYEKKLKMTKQEVKDEYKQTEGDPQLKGKIREKQRQMSQARMMEQVPTADVIVRNPTHFAVAIRYDMEKDLAPIVVAKGQDLIAQKILKIASENDVLIKENKPLARSLYHTVEINQAIPQEFYQLVAELMAWVYSTKKKDKHSWKSLKI